MRALTILQPYAYLIGLSAEAPDAKRIENRTWATSYRGPLCIHAGKSKACLSEHRAGSRGDLVYGAVTAVADLVDCVRLEDLPTAPMPDRPLWPWYRDDPHAFGPYCWLLANVRRLPTPVPMPGALGLWRPDMPKALAVVEQLRLVERARLIGIRSPASSGPHSHADALQ